MAIFRSWTFIAISARIGRLPQISACSSNRHRHHQSIICDGPLEDPGYMLRLKYDHRIYSVTYIRVIRQKLIDIVDRMIKHRSAAVGILLQDGHLKPEHTKGGI